MVKFVEIIEKYYKKNSESYPFLMIHSKAVTEKALGIARKVKHLKPDLEFIEEAAMLHDIGIFLTYAPEIGCYGSKPYICHGYLGAKLLKKENLPKHALACERHVGAGISALDVEKNRFPLPKRDMIPVTVEEEIICYADKFFSKTPEHLTKEKELGFIREWLEKFGDDKVKRFDEWTRKYGC